MEANELLRRTKHAVARWAGVPASSVLLSNKLATLRTGHREELRLAVNQEFAHETGIPIPAVTWSAANAVTVKDLRDLVKQRTDRQLPRKSGWGGPRLAVRKKRSAAVPDCGLVYRIPGL